MPDQGLAARLPGRRPRRPGPASAGAPGAGFWSDARVERLLGAVACLVLLIIVGMIIFVFSKALPSFTHNGLAWFGSGGDVDLQLEDIFNSPSNPAQYVYELRAWPLLWGTFVVGVVPAIVPPPPPPIVRPLPPGGAPARTYQVEEKREEEAAIEESQAFSRYERAERGGFTVPPYLLAFVLLAALAGASVRGGPGARRRTRRIATPAPAFSSADRTRRSRR